MEKFFIKSSTLIEDVIFGIGRDVDRVCSGSKGRTNIRVFRHFFQCTLIVFIPPVQTDLVPNWHCLPLKSRGTLLYLLDGVILLSLLLC